MPKMRRITKRDSLAEQFFRAGYGLADTPRETLVDDFRKIIANALAERTIKEIKKQFWLAVDETLDISESYIKEKLGMHRRGFRTYVNGIFEEARLHEGGKSSVAA